jgi:hypothetical protein
MPLIIIGLLFILFGVFSGTALIIVPLGLVNWETSGSLWVMFPLFCVIGYVLFVIGAKNAEVRTLSIVVSGVLLLLAVGAAAGLVAAATFVTVARTLPLWYVLGIAGVLGFIGMASFNRNGDKI